MQGSKNKYAYEILKAKFFDNIKNIDDLIKKINKGFNFNNRGTEKTKGDIFEIFCEAYLKTNPEYQVKEVYPQGYVPIKIRKKLKLNFQDKGYDGVYETITGELNTYQSKFRSNDEQLTWQGKNGLSSFIGVSEKAHKRHLLATNNKVSSEFLSKSRIQLTLLTDFKKLNEDDFNKINNFLKKKKIQFKKHQPEEYQKIAINKVEKEFKKNNRATIIMACGTGKTEVGLWIYEKRKPKIALVLVPSIALVKQIRASWLSQIDYKIATYQLCSSRDVTKQEDHIQVKKNDLNMEFYTDVRGLRKWIKRNRNIPKIIFSTYQSSKLLGGIFKKKNPIDFAVFDEAHRTAILNSKIDSYFSYALHDKNIPIKKRLFMTATRRVSSQSKVNNTGDGVLNVSMDNPKMYGEVCYNLSFYKAAKKYNAIAKPRIIISEVYSNEVDAEKRKFSSTHIKGLKLKSDYLALIIAIKKAIKKYKIRKVFSFHRTVNDAKIFCDPNKPESINNHLKDFFTNYVSGAMNMRKRDEIMDEFVSSSKGIVSNARCLVEGVNVPAVDMISFTHQKESEVDIVQAIGRALRNRNQNKKFGYVLVPIFVEKKKNESFEQALDRTNFKKVIILLKALREHDTEIAQIIDEILINEGRGKGFSLRNRKKISDLIETVNPEIKKKILIKSIQSKIIDNLRLKWDMMIGKLLDYKKKYNHLNVGYHDKEFLELRHWVTIVRKSFRDNRLYNFQIAQLKKFGFNFKEPGVTTYEIKKNCLSLNQWSAKLNIGIKLLKLALKGVKPDEYFWGPGAKEPVPQWKNLSEDFIKKKLNVTCIYPPNNLVVESKLHLTVFKSRASSSYGSSTISKLIKQGKIKPEETAIGVSSKRDDQGRAIPSRYFKPLKKNQITKLTDITIFDADKYVPPSLFLKNIFGRRAHEGYFKYCLKNGQIKSKGKKLNSTDEQATDVYDQMSKKDFMKLNNIEYFNKLPKNYFTLSGLAKKLKIDRYIINRFIDLKLIKPKGKCFASNSINPVTDFFYLPTQKRFEYMLKVYDQNKHIKKRDKSGKFLN
jgi:superfamily II DNA or RNA helicase